MHHRCVVLMDDTPSDDVSREMILAIARNPESGVSGATAPTLAALVEWMFRYTWFLVIDKRHAMAALAVR